jgi:hypothetical protein
MKKWEIMLLIIGCILLFIGLYHACMPYFEEGMVDTGSVVMTGISTTGAVYYADAGIPSGPNWRALDGTVQQVSGGNGKMIGVNRTTGTVWYSSNQIVVNNTGVARGANWSQVSGTTLNLKHVSLDWPAVYAIDVANKIIYADNIENNTSSVGWNLLPGVTGNFKQIVATQGRGCAIGTDDNIYYIDNLLKSAAKNVMGTLTVGTIAQVSFDGKLVAVVDKSNRLFISRNIDAAAPTWTLINGSLKQISIQSGMAVCIGTDNSAYFTPDVTQQEPGWILMKSPPTNVILQQIEIYLPANKNTRVTRFPDPTKCKSGFNNTNGVCTPVCQTGYTQSGTNCIPPDIPRIQRTTVAVNAPYNSCPSGMELIGNNCYGACPSGYTINSADSTECTMGNIQLPPPIPTASQTIECNDDQASAASPPDPKNLRTYNRFVGTPNSQTCRQECDYGYTYDSSSGLCIGGPDRQNVNGKMRLQTPQIAVCDTSKDSLYPVSENGKCYGKTSCPTNYVRRGDKCTGPTYTPQKTPAILGCPYENQIPNRTGCFRVCGEGVKSWVGGLIGWFGMYSENTGNGWWQLWAAYNIPNHPEICRQNYSEPNSGSSSVIMRSEFPKGATLPVGLGCPFGYTNLTMTVDGPMCYKTCYNTPLMYAANGKGPIGWVINNILYAFPHIGYLPYDEGPGLNDDNGGPSYLKFDGNKYPKIDTLSVGNFNISLIDGDIPVRGGQCKKADTTAVSVAAAIPGPPCDAVVTKDSAHIKDDATQSCYSKLENYTPITFQSKTPIPPQCGPDRTLISGQCYAKCEAGQTTLTGSSSEIAVAEAAFKVAQDAVVVIEQRINDAQTEITNQIKIATDNRPVYGGIFGLQLISGNTTVYGNANLKIFNLQTSINTLSREKAQKTSEIQFALKKVEEAKSVPSGCTAGRQPRPSTPAIVNKPTADSRYSNETCQSEVYGIQSYAYTQASAAAKCASYGAVLATTAQVNEAKAAGANWCSNGWVSDSTTPICPQNPPNTCNWPAAAGSLFGANCFGPKPNYGVYSDIFTFNDAVWNRPNIICYQKCPAGTTEKPTTCGPAPVPIPTGQYTPTIACNQGEELVNGKCISSCPEGTYPDGNTCSPTKQIVPTPGGIKCISTKFGAVNKWLCDSQEDANMITEGPSNKNTAYANLNDQICISDDPTTAMYFCQTVAEALSDSTTSATIQNNYKATCDNLVKTYMDLSNNLMNLSVIRASITDGSTTLAAATTGLNSVYTQMKCATAPANSQIQSLCTEIQRGMNIIGADSTTVKTQLDRFIATITSLLGARSNLQTSIDSVCNTQRSQAESLAKIKSAGS